MSEKPLGTLGALPIVLTDNEAVITPHCSTYWLSKFKQYDTPLTMYVLPPNLLFDHTVC
jgi:hypothetical protein